MPNDMLDLISRPANTAPLSPHAFLSHSVHPTVNGITLSNALSCQRFQ